MQEPHTQWVPLDEPQVARNTCCGRQRFLVRLSQLIGLIALAATLVYWTKSRKSSWEGFSVETHAPVSVLTEYQEPVATAQGFARAVTVSLFNELLATSILTDAKAAYSAVPDRVFETLFSDFLNLIGSEAPNDSGHLRPSNSKYSSRQEHEYRFGVFKSNLFEIMVHNADEYALNPDASRARYLITVHADWTLDEFRTHRLELGAANVSAYEASIRQFEPRKAQAVDEQLGNATELTVQLGKMCHISTGGTCQLLPCHASRGAVCYGGQCICTDGACAKNGECIRPGHCEVSTGGSCWLLPCRTSRHAQCVNHHCICPLGTCAVNGQCVPSKTPGQNPFDVTCSSAILMHPRQQGGCGSCWAFSTVQQLRLMTFKKYNHDPGVLSAQYLIDCMPEVQAHSCSGGVKGCCGGLPFRADKWLSSSGGLPTQRSYGPQLSDQHPRTEYQCHSEVRKRVMPIGVEQYNTEVEVANAYCRKGPVSIAIHANDKLMHYGGGIMTESSCPVNRINHAVLYVGVDKTHDDGNPVHIILNSWGEWWGVSARRPYKHVAGANGHVLFKFGENVCNMMALATAPSDVELL